MKIRKKKKFKSLEIDGGKGLLLVVLLVSRPGTFQNYLYRTHGCALVQAVPVNFAG